jgi:hypothetical protein
MVTIAVIVLVPTFFADLLYCKHFLICFLAVLLFAFGILVIFGGTGITQLVYVNKLWGYAAVFVGLSMISLSADFEKALMKL